MAQQKSFAERVHEWAHEEEEVEDSWVMEWDVSAEDMASSSADRVAVPMAVPKGAVRAPTPVRVRVDRDPSSSIGGAVGGGVANVD